MSCACPGCSADMCTTQPPPVKLGVRRLQDIQKSIACHVHVLYVLQTCTLHRPLLSSWGSGACREQQNRGKRCEHVHVL
jgi:hypothetical protein